MLLLAGEDDDYFAFDFFLFEVGKDLGECSSGGFGVEFAYLAADAHLALFAQHGDEFFQSRKQLISFRRAT